METKLWDDKTKEVYDLLDRFIELAKKRAVENPMLVVVLMHEYFRNIWPNDPFLTKKFSEDKLENVILCLKSCIEALEKTEFIATYFNSKEDVLKLFPQKQDIDKEMTQKVYGGLWKKLGEDYLVEESKNVLINLFEKNGKNVDELRGKKVLDMGCGSGRFTIGFAQLGVEHVTGIDLGEQGIFIGTEISKKLGLKNIEFKQGDVLALPFEDNYFDFVFSKGVLHHTGDLEKGLKEFHRVLKKGGKGFLYLYGDGGVFWKSRTRMREVMKLIPIEYTKKVLDLLGMPTKRYIFTDSWYVPIEEHVSRERLIKFLEGQNYLNMKKVEHTGTSGLDGMSNMPYSKELWGDGELRYFLTK